MYLLSGSLKYINNKPGISMQGSYSYVSPNGKSYTGILNLKYPSEPEVCFEKGSKQLFKYLSILYNLYFYLYIDAI